MWRLRATSKRYQPAVFKRRVILSAGWYDTTINEASVFLDQKAEVNSLSITNNSSPETLRPENLTVDTNFQNAGQSLFVSASNLLVKSNLSNTGSLETYNANAPTTGPAAHITVDGTLTNSSNGNVTLGGYAPDTLTVGTLVNDGAGNSGLPPSLSIPTGATLTVKNQLDLEGWRRGLCGNCLWRRLRFGEHDEVRRRDQEALRRVALRGSATRRLCAW
ncbi:hypothetical protein [Acidibrevibacterium fodinaquatile]|uniref:hypothetical protein n=1 Tax=Acidibrevibacterium fodinaquatile TaxID=1969806 RepID=UPI0013B3C102|nr:hypothetical protein [Acidibrevibacterium fodinaquatile]